jgi:hypothetical protein
MHCNRSCAIGFAKYVFRRTLQESDRASGRLAAATRTP